jgi:plastocyanin
MTTTRRALALLAVLVLPLTLAACGDDSGSDAGGSASASGTEQTPAIKDREFLNLDVEAGSEVTVRNEDGVTHTFTADDGSFDTGEIAGGETGEFTAPADAGDFDIHCEIHSDMKATLTVT